MHALAHESPAPLGPTLLRAWFRPFLLAFTGLTLVMLANQAWRRLLPLFEANRLDLPQAGKLLLLTLPFIAALTLPFAVLLASVYAFRRRARGVSSGVSLARQLRPTLLAALGLAVVTYVLVDQVVPRTNLALRRLLIATQSRQAPAPQSPDYLKSDREMTSAELSAVVREAEIQMAGAKASGDLKTANAAGARAAQYRVEIQKKQAIAAACVVFALVGAGLGTSLASRRWLIPFGAALALLGLYYIGVTVGEDLANTQQLSPALGMWGANLVLTLLGAVLLWQAAHRSTGYSPREARA